MYEYIKGMIVSRNPEYIVLDHQGIGYQIYTANPFSFTIDTINSTIIYLYHHVREDNISLFGFKTVEERQLFKKLLNVSGIGPKGALAILAYGQPQQVVHAIEEENETFLTKFPGVGKKTARQMILDLKGKLQDFVGEEIGLFETISDEPSHSDMLEEAILALKALGYSDREVKKITPQLTKQSLNTDEYIKLALKLLLKA